MSSTDIVEEIKSKRLPVIICGAGIVGQALLSVCNEHGIEVECFSDNSIKAARSSFCGKEVIFTPDLKARFEDAVFLVSAAAIKDVVEGLRDLGYRTWYAGGLLLRDLDVSQGESVAAIDYAKYAIETCILCHEHYLTPDKLSLRSIDIMITERCSLRCAGCSNLMQYYAKPQDCEIGQLLKEVDALCSVVDAVTEFRVIGGEVFMNREWPIVVERLTNEPKGKRVVLYTNGTILPDDDALSHLENPKVLVSITNYGDLSRRLGQVTKALEERKVAHHVISTPEWIDCSSVIPHHRSTQEKKDLFKSCCAKNMATLSNGRLYRCPYAANAARLRAVPGHRSDYVDLSPERVGTGNLQDIKDELRDYLLNKDYLEICDYCSGRPLVGPAIEPAVQARTPVAYHKYAGY